MSPERLWRWSNHCHRGGRHFVARLLKTLNYVLFRAVLPVEVTPPPDLSLMHRGLGVVVHPSTVIGRRVVLGHQVTLGADVGGRVVLEDDVFVGVGALVLAARDREVTIGHDTGIGGGCVVKTSVPPHSIVRAPRPDVQSPQSGAEPGR